MALINCVDCGKAVSDKAKICPNCGCPIECSLEALQQAENQTTVSEETAQEPVSEDIVHEPTPSIHLILQTAKAFPSRKQLFFTDIRTTSPMLTALSSLM